MYKKLLARSMIMLLSLAVLSACSDGKGTKDESGEPYVSLKSASLEQNGNKLQAVDLGEAKRSLSLKWKVNYRSIADVYTMRVSVVKDGVDRTILTQNCGNSSLFNCGQSGDFVCSLYESKIKCDGAPYAGVSIPAGQSQLQIKYQACIVKSILEDLCDSQVVSLSIGNNDEGSEPKPDPTDPEPPTPGSPKPQPQPQPIDPPVEDPLEVELTPPTIPSANPEGTEGLSADLIPPSPF